MHTFKLPPSLLPTSITISPHKLLTRRSSSKSSIHKSSISASPSPVRPSTPKLSAAHIEMFSPAETDAQCWERMVALQREYRCYNSARLEAAVEARDSGREVEVLVPSRLCLDLMNESLKAWIDAHREGLVA
ncbi:hypothetical protein HYALB_00003225 [Hymenoscyphus albidus]|uniref:Uncharacterized protein n=1 Tax=Hymenoscyphus albidus TaxID=595503 RepID=A0A9N9LWE1_9HELO|nr:hypothetical protein HYALB_00003225 [Hymenoscyphus albidus]